MEHPHIRRLSEWRPLARGSRAVVWEARQLSLGRLVAVKVYQSDLDEDDRRRFLREAAAVGRLSSHPGVVTVHDAGILPDDRPYLIMELYPGGSLTQWLKPENRPSEECVRQVGVRIADALAAVHARDVLHRDVKPANILIDRFGSHALADFGLAVVTSAEAAATDPLGMTPAYAPPEAFEALPATEAGDVFSLAATLYALMAGHPPRSVDAECIALEQMIETAKKPVVPIPWVSWCLMDVLLTALNNDPATRPTAARFRDQLMEVPVAQISAREPLVRTAEDRSRRLPRRPPALPVHPTGSPSSDAAVALRAPDPQQTPDELAPVDAVPAEAPPERGRRRTGIMALAAALLAVVASGTVWATGDPASSGVSAETAPRAIPGGPGSSPSYSDPQPQTSTPIQLEAPADPAKPFQTVSVEGIYHGGAETFLRVQRLEDGRWQDFPLLTKTDRSGQFTAYVELGEPGVYQLRALDPDSGMMSKPSELVIMG